MIPRLQKETHFTVDEKSRTASLTDEGVALCEQMLKVDNLYDPRYMELVHHINQALKAHTLFKRDVDYIVQDGEVVIVDEFTGRLMPGRRYSEGLHQALEAKEKIKVKSENQTLATITFQNYFRMYDKLAGMTGTADTEAEEFHKIYKLEVMVIPTHREMIRKDNPDSIYRTQDEKYQAAVEEIKELYAKGQPVLVGTISVEKSEMLASKLKRLGVPHTVFNAKHHAKEAEIVAQAGRKGAVTISTNMAGRGTDIVLGGNPEAMALKDADPQEDPEGFQQALAKYTELCAGERDEVMAAGGLHILGTERHESRRIDNQLRGRSGRQGDPGSSRFYLSLEDELLRLFGSDRIKGIMGKLGMEEGEPIEHNMISKAIENAQRKVEGRNFQIRKQLLEYDDVLNKQREVIYAQRRMAMTGEGVHDSILEMFEELAEEVVLSHADDSTPADEWDLKAIKDAVKNAFGFAPQIAEVEQYDAEGLAEEVGRQALKLYAFKEKNYGPETMRQLERWILLDRVDSLWKDHLLNMDHLKEGIGLRGYGQKDPLREYQREGYEMFADMVERIKHETVGTLMRVQIASEEDLQAMAPEEEIPMSFSGGEEAQRTRDGAAQGQEGGAQRPLPLRQRQEVQEVLRPQSRPPLSGPLADVDEPVDQAHHHRPPQDVAQGHGQQIAPPKPLPAQPGQDGRVQARGRPKAGRRPGLGHQGQGHEEHVGHRVLEARGHKGADGKHDGQHLVRGAPRAVAQPDGQTHQHIAQGAQGQGLHEAVGALGLGRQQEALAHRARGQGVVPGQEHQPCGGHRPGEVAHIDQAPVAQQAPGAHPAAGPGHDDEVVAGEQLGPAHHHQDQAQAEGHSPGQAHQAPGRARGPGHGGEVKHPSHGDEGPGQKGQAQGGARAQGGLGRAGLLGLEGHVRGQQGVIGRHGKLMRRVIHGYPPWLALLYEIILNWARARASVERGTSKTIGWPGWSRCLPH